MQPILRLIQGPCGVVLALLLCVALARGQDCYVVSAGIDNYPAAKRLSGCLNDARNTVATFKAQQGLAFGKVHAVTLLDGQATLASIGQKFQEAARQAKAGDFVVLFLSGHGATSNQTWYFLPFDFNPRNELGTGLTDRQILGTAEESIKQGKNVIVIVDACFAGQLRVAAGGLLRRPRSSQEGGLILMLSSSATQTSAALGQYSAFAKSLTDSMNGGGDLNRDGKVTLEIKQDTYQRTQQFLRQRKIDDRQDSEVAWSPSVPEHLTLAKAQQIASLPPMNRTPTKPLLTQPSPKRPTPFSEPAEGGPAEGGAPDAPPIKPRPTSTQATQWSGSEDLKGFGKLRFDLQAGGRAIMHDARGTSEGTWERDGQTMTIRFNNGRIIYSGTLAGTTLRGMASNGKTSWPFRVQSVRQAAEASAGLVPLR